MGGLDLSVLRQLQQRPKALASRDNGVFLALGFDDKVLLQAVGLDARGKLINESFVLRLADVARKLRELVERNICDSGGHDGSPFWLGF